MPYSVDASGGLTVGTDIGQVSPDGAVVLLADTTFLDDDFSMVMIGIRQGGGMSNATLAGDYVASQLMIDLVGPLAATSGITGTADGAGTLSGTFNDSDGGAGSYSLNYSVADSGAMTFPDTGESGQISQSGEAFVLADVDPVDDSLMFMFGLRKIDLGE